jgi:hypothetical protein
MSLAMEFYKIIYLKECMIAIKGKPILKSIGWLTSHACSEI